MSEDPNEVYRREKEVELQKDLEFQLKKFNEEKDKETYQDSTLKKFEEWAQEKEKQEEEEKKREDEMMISDYKKLLEKSEILTRGGHGGKTRRGGSF